MNIIFNPQKLKISETFRKKIISKFEHSLGNLLKNYQEDLKIASLSIERFARSGYEIKFDMNLPGAPLNIKESSKVLMAGIIKVRDQAKRQLKKYISISRGR